MVAGVLGRKNNPWEKLPYRSAYLSLLWDVMVILKMIF